MRKTHFLYLFIIQFLVVAFFPSIIWGQRVPNGRKIGRAIQASRTPRGNFIKKGVNTRASVAPVMVSKGVLNPSLVKRAQESSSEIQINLEKKIEQLERLRENQQRNAQERAEMATYKTTTRRAEEAKKSRMLIEEEMTPSTEKETVPLGALSFQEQWRNQSITAEFHWRTKEDISEAEIMGDPYRRALDLYKKPTPVKSSKRSKESLLAEGQADGILPENWQELSREELENFIRTVRQMQEKIENIRFNKYRQKFVAQASLAGENMIKGSCDYEAEVWAYKQPDFFEKNFMNLTDTYMEPFHEQIMKLRILIVNDEDHLLQRYLDSQDPRVMVEGVRSVSAAISKLKENPENYDIIFTDYHLADATARKLSSYVLMEELNIPIISLANAEALPSWWYNIGMDGSLPHQEAQHIYNYASNIVATGRAFPNKE